MSQAPKARWLLVLVALAPNLAAAQAVGDAPAQREASGQPESAAYAEQIEAAIAEFARENWTEAYALFSRAHALDPNARTLRGLGICAFEDKHYVRAVQHLRQALAESRKALDPAQLEEARAVIARAEAFTARVTLIVEPANAAITIDAQPVPRDEQGRVLLDPGSHELNVSLHGHAPQTRVVEVRPGDQLTLALELQPAASQAPSAEPSVQPVTAQDSTWAWVAGGAAATLAATGLALWFVADAGVGAIEDACPPGACSRAAIDRKIDDRSLETLQVGYMVSFALAGACAVTSVVLFATGAEGAEGTRVTLAPGGLLAEGRF